MMIFGRFLGVAAVIVFVSGPAYTFNKKASADKKKVYRQLVLLKNEVAKVKGFENELKFNMGVLEGFYGAVSEATEDDAVEFILEQAQSKAYDEQFKRLKFYLIESLGYHKSDKVYEYFENLLKDNDQLLHIAVSNALAINTEDSDLKYIIMILEGDKHPWEAKFEAVNSLSHIKEQLKDNEDTLLKLADLLDNPHLRRRIKRSVAGVLKEVTGQDAQVNDSFSWRQIIKKQEIRKTGIARKMIPKFFDLAIDSDRVVFVLDYSKSMDGLKWGNMIPSNLPKYEGEELEAFEEMKKTFNSIATGIDKKNPTCREGILDRSEMVAFLGCKKFFDQWAERIPGTRLDVLRKEIVKAIILLDCEVYFNIVLFHGNYTLYQEELVQANWQNKLSAVKFVVSTATILGTLTGKGLVCAYSFVEEKRGEVMGPKFTFQEKIHPFLLSNGVDTVVLFTDGMPIWDPIGQNKRGDLIVDFFDHIRASRKVQINTIGFLNHAESDWLVELAEKNYGEARIYE